jgi:mono/diheme cytochrome c family protein
MKTLRLVAPLVVVLGSSCAGIPLPRESLTNPSALLFNGYAKPDVACYKCHGGDGKGTMRGPNLFKGAPEKTDKEIVEYIKNGKSFMPSFKDKLNDDEVNQLLAWVRETFPSPAAASTPAAAPAPAQ